MSGRITRFRSWLRRTHSALVHRYRTYAVASAAHADFVDNRLRYHTYYFTVNAFMGVLALFVALSSFIALLPSNEFKRQLVEAIKSIMPIMRGSSAETLNVFKTFGVLGILSILFLLWTATRISDALESGFTVIWKTEKRRFTGRMLVGLFMIAVIGVLFIVTSGVQFGLTRLLGAVFETRGVGYHLGTSLAKPIVGLLVDFLLFFFIYRVVTGVKPGWGNCARASIAVGALFLGSQYLLNLYFDHIYKVPLVYGSLASGVILVLWLQLTGVVTFYGAEVVYVLENENLVSEHIRSLSPGT
ncbi:MAG: YihY/virulence factor BrkB family protein [Actinobacteria bacterium]|nr:YihY/virulence factor BrkB family protein [Actinomycetota bacterium]MBU1945145.1 YihY/virulence factor BrkB family protein [Actinomycetota bacterium]MBU2686405.1 YihY/virulence factor BrkB family protein [Actinomycetota bacterium]